MRGIDDAAGGPIPRAFGHDARNVTPPLSIANVPPEGSMTLIMDDPHAV